MDPLLAPDLVLRGPRVTLRPSRAEDVDALVALLAEPSVVRWWRTTTREDVLGALAEGVTVLVAGAIRGWLLVDEETDPDYPSVAFDIAVADALQGQGYGREALSVLIRHCITCGHDRFTIDPAVDNDRAIRSYTAVGFRPVGVLREYERLADGRRGDGLLMDLLARELRA